jgi:hypothetical protein
VGANPVDRAKRGSKLHLAVEGGGLPLSVLVTGANTNDGLVFEALLDDLPACARRPAVGAAGPRRSMPTRPTTIAAAAATCRVGGSRCALPAVGSSPRSGWAATAGGGTHDRLVGGVPAVAHPL